MPANFARVFALTPNIGYKNALLSTAMTNTKAYDGTEVAGTAMVLAYTVGANGGSPNQLRVQYTSTNGATASGTTNATVVRFWANDPVAGVNTVAANNIYLGETSIPAATITALATTANNVAGLFNVPSLPAGYKIYAGLTVAIGGTNCALSLLGLGGDF